MLYRKRTFGRICIILLFVGVVAISHDFNNKNKIVSTWTANELIPSRFTHSEPHNHVHFILKNINEQYIDLELVNPMEQTLFYSPDFVLEFKRDDQWWEILPFNSKGTAAIEIESNQLILEKYFFSISSCKEIDGIYRIVKEIDSHHYASFQFELVNQTISF